MNELRFVVPGHPPTPNDRLDRYALNRERQAFRAATKYLATDAKNASNLELPFETVALSFAFLFRANRKRDLDNLIASVKPIIDGIVDARIITDDDLDHVFSISATARILAPGESPRDQVVVSVKALA